MTLIETDQTFGQSGVFSGSEDDVSPELGIENSPDYEMTDLITALNPRVREYYGQHGIEGEQMDARVCSEAVRLSDLPRMNGYVAQGWLSEGDMHYYEGLLGLYSHGNKRMEGKLYMSANKTGVCSVPFENLIDAEVICVLAEMRKADPTHGAELTDRWYDLVTEDPGSEYLFEKDARGKTPLILVQEMMEFMKPRA